MSRRLPLLLATSLILACTDDPSGDTSDSDSESGGSDEVGETSSTSDSGSETGTSDADDESETSESDDETDTGETDTGGPLDDVLTLEHIQVKGTHNSYHIEPMLPLDASHEYTHPPLDVQLEEFGVRAFELDLHKAAGILQVYHLAVVDSQTTCNTLSLCLETIEGWSDQHPGHVPIMVWFEIKDNVGGDPIDDLLLVDQTILDVFEPSRVLTPDFVQGDHATLREAIEAEGWPTLGEVRGKIMFMILNGDHDSVDAYTNGGTSLANRMMFVGTNDFTAPYAAVSKINDPADSAIADAHAAGILTASNLCGAGSDDDECFAKLEAAKASGTHNLKDDFLAPVEGMTYFLDLPDGNPARCNEVTAPPECTAEAIEDLP
jgi:hypothetical protein